MLDNLAQFLVSVVKPRYEESFVDRLNYSITSWILIACSITLTTKILTSFKAPYNQVYIGGKSVQCWVPAQFTGGWEEYVEDYCFIENTYYLPAEQRIPTDIDERNRRMLNYYQWVPFVLALMALMFNIPHIIWRSVNWLSGLSVRSVVGMACEAVEVGAEKERDIAKLVSSHIRESIEITTAISKSGNPFGWVLSCGMAKGIYVVLCYLTMKSLFLINLVLQFYILKSFLGPSYNYWGAAVLQDLATGHDWRKSGHFPRVTLCDFQVRVLGNLQRFTVQCVVMMNMLHEKMFLFIWWWFMIVAVITALDLCWWLFTSALPMSRESFIKQMLNAQGLPARDDEGRLYEFSHRLILPDGVLALRLMAKNAGDVFTSQVVARMWKDYIVGKKQAAKIIQPPSNAGRYAAPPGYEAIRHIDEPDSHFGNVKPTML